MDSFRVIEEKLLSENCVKMGEKNNFKIQIDGLSLAPIGGQTLLCSTPDLKIDFIKEFQNGNTKTLVFSGVYKNINLTISENFEFINNTDIIKQTIKIVNNGEINVDISRISNTVISGIGSDGLLSWYDDKRFNVNFCEMAWEGEAQWRTAHFKELGLYPNSVHPNTKIIKLFSKGSWSTARYYPLIILEDKEIGKSFFLEVEPRGSWEIDIYNSNNKYGTDGCISVESNTANIDNDGWVLTLAPNEEYTTDAVIYGYTNGDFEDAVKQLTIYKRHTNLAHFKNEINPLIYNCYMNGIFSQPTTKTLIPLINSASDLGVDIFCIDAGWFRSLNDKQKNAIGDYNVADDRFKGYGLQGIIDYIKSKNMIPGLWLEIECCQNMGGFGYTLSENCLLKRNSDILGGNRAFFNLCDNSVRKHLLSVVDKLYNMGVKFIKNDYNQTTNAGFNNNSKNIGLEYPNYFNALISLLKEIRRKYPELIIENCGSGAMRCDNNILKHFEIQSTSDQELYNRYASIASGSLSLMPPEKAGIWAYPYPLLAFQQTFAFDDMEFWKEKAYGFADGEETIFNMANGLLGNIYMSGRIDMCDNLNLQLIKDAIEIYKKQDNFLKDCFPIWPSGKFHIVDCGIFSTGLINKELTKIRLIVWSINSKEKISIIDLSKYLNSDSSVSLIYPKNDLKCKFNFNIANKSLSICMPENKYSARVFEISI